MTDEGRTYTGLAQLRAWLGKAESDSGSSSKPLVASSRS